MIRLDADFSKAIRPIGKLNGTNNGPLCSFGDETENFKKMGVDFIRFHETHCVNADCIEIPFVFPDFDADEYDPANYNFEATDAVIKAAVDIGAEIMYRFGMGTESYGRYVFCVIPPDFEKWARICVQILKHYNDGWANGFYYGIKYCEIWNEADLSKYWQGDYSEYIKLYDITARMMKGYDPTLKIGCSGLSHSDYDYPPVEIQGRELEERKEIIQHFWDLLTHVTENGVPFDFYAYHHYGKDSTSAEYRTGEICKYLNEFELPDVEIINTEWNCVRLHRDSQGRWDRSQRATVKSAVGCLATLLVFQKMGVSKAAYYDADNRAMAFFCGLYDFKSQPGGHFYSLKAFSMLRDGETERYTSGDGGNIRMVASGKGGKAYIAITCEDQDADIQLRISALPPCDIKYYLLDEQHKLKHVRTGIFNGRALPIKMEANSAYILEFVLSRGVGL